MGECAIVLLSGGLDSATTLAIARRAQFDCVALTIDYGQRHAVELAAATTLAKALGAIEHRVIRIDLRALGASALTADIAVPKNRKVGVSDEIPVTYVPARNTVFLSLALALAEVRASRDVFIGVNALDYSGYPDCRPEYIAAYERMAALATRAGVEGSPTRIHAPLIGMTKEAIVRRGLELAVDFAVTRSCYDPDPAGRACGHCDSCQLRLAAFSAVGIADPCPYAMGGEG